MSNHDRQLQRMLDEEKFEGVKREILGISDIHQRRAVLERLFVSDLNYPGATPNRGRRLVALELHALLTPDAIERVKQAAAACLVSSALEAGIARLFAESLDRLPFTEAQLVQRRPVWAALSELFLDTETRPQIPDAALACELSGLSMNELGFIWFRELCPVLAPNLASPAGEWAGFDLAWLEKSIVARRCQPHQSHQNANRLVWTEVVRLIGWLRDWPSGERRQVAICVRNQVRVAYGLAAFELTDEDRLGLDEQERCWQEGSQPLLASLHIAGADPALADIFAAGGPLRKGEES